MQIKLHSKLKLLTVLIFVLFIGASSAFAQINAVKNLPKYDNQKYHFGFLIGFNFADFKITHIPDFATADSIFRVEPLGQSGFNLGIVTNMRLAENWDLRFVPDLQFSQRDLEYTFYVNGSPESTEIKAIESTYLNFPIDLKFKSNRVGNYRAYVTAGVKYGIDMVSQKKVENLDSELVKLERQDYGYSIGVGFDFYLQMFKFSPEIKMFTGLRNLKADDPLIYSTSIDKLNSKTFLLSFTFE
ncbi:MAG: PorT family protein [Bacteroidia bacterium]|nr:PorT family protein [Bacteroidia bacterium]